MGSHLDGNLTVSYHLLDIIRETRGVLIVKSSTGSGIKPGSFGEFSGFSLKFVDIP
jgi:hypothetical protein